MPHLHLREAMALPSRIAQYLKRHQSNHRIKRKSGTLFKKKHQDAVDQTVHSINPNPRKRSSAEITDAARDAFIDRFIDADAAPPNKRPRWPVAEDRDEFRSSCSRKRSSDEFEEVSDASSDRFIDADAPPPQKRPRWPAVEDCGDSTSFPEKQSRPPAEVEEIPDATADEDGNPFEDHELTDPNLPTLLADELIGTTDAEAGDPHFLEAILDLAHLSFDDCPPTSFGSSRSLAEELAVAVANEDTEPFDDPDKLLPGAPEIGENVTISIVLCEESPLRDREALVSQPQGRSLADELFDATSDEEGDPFEEAETNFHSLEEQIVDGMSHEIGQELHDTGSAHLMRLDSPAKKLADSIASEDEDISDIENDASFVTALETLSDSEFLTEDEDAPVWGRRLSLADEIADATSGEEGDPFNVDEDLPADIMDSESSAEARKRPASSKYLSAPGLLGGCTMQ